MTAEELFALIATAIVLLGGLFSSRSFARRKMRQLEKEGAPFADAPALYHQKVIEVEGVVVHQFRNSFFEVAKRKFVDLVRTKTGSSDHRHRHVHQRFLMKCPELHYRKTLLIEHNLKAGRIPLRKGVRVRVKGEYLHTVSTRSRNLYGRIHKTYDPTGFIEVLG